MEFRSSNALRVIGIVFGVLTALRFLWIAQSIFIVAFLGVLLGLAMTRAVDSLERARIRRGVGAPLVMVLLIGALAAAVVLVTTKMLYVVDVVGDDVRVGTEE